MTEYPRAMFLTFLCTLMIIGWFIKEKRKQNNLSEEEKTKLIENRFKNSVKSALIVGIICFSIIASISGAAAKKFYDEDGAYVFQNETTNLNESLKNGKIPEAGTYVKINFSLVGEEYYSENEDMIFHPIVLSGTGDKPHVVGLCENINGSDVIDQLGYLSASTPFILKGTDVGELPEITYTGRVTTMHVTLDNFNTALTESNITYDNYIIDNIYIDTSDSKEDLKKSIMIFFIIFIASAFIDLLLIITTIALRKKL